jgi:hypothetical protein
MSGVPGLTAQDVRLLAALRESGCTTVFSIKRGLPHTARYERPLPDEPLTGEEVIALARDLVWGDVLLQPEADGRYRVLRATKQVQLGG